MADHPDIVLDRAIFETVVSRTADALRREGFTLVSEVELARSPSGKPDPVGGRRSILLACNPALAYKAISLDSQSGVFLTSRIVIRENPAGHIGLSFFNPMECMEANMSTSSLEEVSVEVSNHLRNVIDRLQIPES